jgi:hypothetical protein
MSVSLKANGTENQRIKGRRRRNVDGLGGLVPFGFAVYFVFGKGDVFDFAGDVNLTCPTHDILIASPLPSTLSLSIHIPNVNQQYTKQQ